MTLGQTDLASLVTKIILLEEMLLLHDRIKDEKIIAENKASTAT